jgi:hypothetical protein
MITDIHNAIIKAPPSTIDSLKYSLYKMQGQVDSLQKIVTKTEIGTEFFSDAISSNLYNFSTIVFFAGLVAWGSIYTALAIHKRQIKSDVNKQLSQFKMSFDEKQSDIEKSLENTIYDVNRAMYSKVTADEDWPNSFVWAVECMVYFNKTNEDIDHDKGVLFWLEMANESLDKITDSDTILGEYTTKITDHLLSMGDYKNAEVITLSKAILKKFNHLVYTIPSVPDDLFETDSTP